MIIFNISETINCLWRIAPLLQMRPLSYCIINLKKFFSQQEVKEEKHPFDRLPTELIENLLEYKKIQASAEQLEKICSASQYSLNKKPEWDQYEENMDLLKVDLISFLKAFQEHLNKDEHRQKTQFAIEEEEAVLAELYEWLYDRLLEVKRISFFLYSGELFFIQMYWIFSCDPGNGKTKKNPHLQNSQKDILLQLT